MKLRRQGREYVGLSPFTKERTPSFFVNDDKGFFHDFSSGKNGDLISFLQETERLTFVEAVERLAAEAGMALPAPDPRAAETEKKRRRPGRLAGAGGRLVRGASCAGPPAARRATTWPAAACRRATGRASASASRRPAARR